MARVNASVSSPVSAVGIVAATRRASGEGPSY
jgi:hypothetical protein